MHNTDYTGPEAVQVRLDKRGVEDKADIADKTVAQDIVDKVIAVDIADNKT